VPSIWAKRNRGIDPSVQNLWEIILHTFQAKLCAKLFSNVQLFCSGPMFSCMAYCSRSNWTQKCSRSNFEHPKYSKTFRRVGLPNGGAYSTPPVPLTGGRGLAAPSKEPPPCCSPLGLRTPDPNIPHFQITSEATTRSESKVRCAILDFRFTSALQNITLKMSYDLAWEEFQYTTSYHTGDTSPSDTTAY